MYLVTHNNVSPADKRVSSPQTSENTSKTYSHSCEIDSSANTSLADLQNQTRSPRKSETPPGDCDFKVDGLTSTPNLVTSVQQTDVVSPCQPVCEGSFVGKARHKDGSLLGIIFQVTSFIVSVSVL